MSGVNRGTLPWNTQLGDTVRRKRMKKLLDQNPCISSPAAPSALALVFDFEERAKHDRIRAKCSFDSVQSDADGFELQVKIDRYVVEFQHAPTSDHNNDDWADEPRHHVVNAIDPDWKSFTVVGSTDLFTSNKHGFRNGDKVKVRSTPPSPLVIGTVYWVINATDNTFKLATSQGGAAVNIAADGDGEVGYSVPHRYNIWFHGQIQKRKWYRFRVRAIDKDKKRSDWSAWEPLHGAQPADTTPPPSPLLVNIHQNARDRIVVDWDDPLDVDDPEIADEDIAYYQVQLSKLVGFSTTYRFDRFQVASHRSFKVKPADEGSNFYARVRSVDSSRNKSAWIPAKIDPGNSNPAATADSANESTGAGVGNPPNQPAPPTVAFDAAGTRHAKFRAIVTAGTSVTDGTHDAPHRYVIQMVHHQTSGASPPAGAKRHHGSVEGDATGDDLTETFRNIPKNHYVWVRERARNAAGASGWTNWVGGATLTKNSGAAASPANPTGVSVTAPAPRRVKVTWDDPEDDDTVRWRVDIRRGGSVVDTGYTRSTRYIYHVPKAFAGVIHNAHVYAISDTGTLSSLVLSGDGTPLDDSSVLVGSIRWHAGVAVPTGYAHCDGSVYNPTTYPLLYGAISTTYGGTSGSPLLPDIKNRKVKAKGNLGTLGGNEGLAEGSRDDNHGHGNHKHGNHKHDGHQHNNHDHTNHGHGAHGHDVHGNRGSQDPTDHQHGGDGPNTFQTNLQAGGSQRLATDTHQHNGQGRNNQHGHNSHGDGYYIQGEDGDGGVGRHGIQGTQQGQAYFDGQNGFGEAVNDLKGDLPEATNDSKRSPHIVLWAIIKLDDL